MDTQKFITWYWWIVLLSQKRDGDAHATLGSCQMKSDLLCERCSTISREKTLRHRPHKARGSPPISASSSGEFPRHTKEKPYLSLMVTARTHGIANVFEPFDIRLMQSRNVNSTHGTKQYRNISMGWKAKKKGMDRSWRTTHDIQVQTESLFVWFTKVKYHLFRLATIRKQRLQWNRWRHRTIL